MNRHQVLWRQWKSEKGKRISHGEKSQKEGLTYNFLWEKVVAVSCACVCVWAYICSICTIYRQLETFLQQLYERVVGSPITPVSKGRKEAQVWKGKVVAEGNHPGLLTPTRAPVGPRAASPSSWCLNTQSVSQKPGREDGTLVTENDTVTKDKWTLRRRQRWCRSNAVPTADADLVTATPSQWSTGQKTSVGDTVTTARAGTPEHCKQGNVPHRRLLD